MENTITKDKQKTDIKTRSKFPWHIILINDDFNTFEHVIDMLVKYCKHTPQQAEQCANIVHYNTRCSVKEGEYEDLVPIWEALLDAHLKAEIEETQ